jgi:hypothetical protein
MLYPHFTRVFIANTVTNVSFNATIFTTTRKGLALICPDGRKELIWIDLTNGAYKVCPV